jgi:hypothetical protein
MGERIMAAIASGLPMTCMHNACDAFKQPVKAIVLELLRTACTCAG